MKKYKFLIFKFKSWVVRKYTAQQSRKKRYYKKKHYKPYMAKKTIYPGTQGRKNTVLTKAINK